MSVFRCLNSTIILTYVGHKSLEICQQMLAVNNLTTDISPQTSHHRHLTTDISPQTPHHRHLTTDISPQTSHHRHLTTDISPQTSHHRHLTTDISPQTPHHRHLTTDTSPQTSPQTHHRHISPQTSPLTHHRHTDISPQTSHHTHHRHLTTDVRLMPPFSFFLNVMFGGDLLRRIPKPSSSCSSSFLCCRGFRTSRTMKIRLHVRATATTQNHVCTQLLEPRRHTAARTT